MRSFLFVPADSERKIEKALGCGADVVILDLEDSVATAGKGKARDIAGNVVRDRHNTGPALYIRINPIHGEFTDADIACVNAATPDGIVQPKPRSALDVLELRKKLDAPLPIVAIATETAASLFHLGTYAEHADELAPMTGLTWGAEDLSNELAASTSRDEQNRLTHPYQMARTLCLAGARAAGFEPIDTVCVDFRDAGALEHECEEALRDGFSGKLAIHPAQIETINRVFTPSGAAVAEARAVIAAFEAAGNPGVVGLDGQMYDRPHLERARKLLARSEKYA